MLQQMASVAELEAGMISDRTRRALAAVKERGKKLGGARHRKIDGKRVTITLEIQDGGVAALQARASARAADIAPTIKELQAAGAESLRAIAAGLNAADQSFVDFSSQRG